MSVIITLKREIHTDFCLVGIFTFACSRKTIEVWVSMENITVSAKFNVVFSSTKSKLDDLRSSEEFAHTSNLNLASGIDSVPSILFGVKRMQLNKSR